MTTATAPRPPRLLRRMATTEVAQAAEPEDATATPAAPPATQQLPPDALDIPSGTDAGPGAGEPESEPVTGAPETPAAPEDPAALEDGTAPEDPVADDKQTGRGGLVDRVATMVHSPWKRFTRDTKGPPAEAAAEEDTLEDTAPEEDAAAAAVTEDPAPEEDAPEEDTLEDTAPEEDAAAAAATKDPDATATPSETAAEAAVEEDTASEDTSTGDTDPATASEDTAASTAAAEDAATEEDATAADGETAPADEDTADGAAAEEDAAADPGSETDPAEDIDIPRMTRVLDAVETDLANTKARDTMVTTSLDKLTKRIVKSVEQRPDPVESIRNELAALTTASEEMIRKQAGAAASDLRRSASGTRRPRRWLVRIAAAVLVSISLAGGLAAQRYLGILPVPDAAWREYVWEAHGASIARCVLDAQRAGAQCRVTATVTE